MDFMHDGLIAGGKFRSFNVIDDYNREALNITLDTSITSKRVIRELDKLIEWRGKPERLRVDNGPEFSEQVRSFGHDYRPIDPFVLIPEKSEIQQKGAFNFLLQNVGGVRKRQLDRSLKTHTLKYRELLGYGLYQVLERPFEETMGLVVASYGSAWVVWQVFIIFLMINFQT